MKVICEHSGNCQKKTGKLPCIPHEKNSICSNHNYCNVACRFYACLPCNHSLKSRIESINENSTLKEADDILQECYDKDNIWRVITITAKNDGGFMGLRDGSHKIIKEISYKAQCQKLVAFKKILLFRAKEAGLLEEAKSCIHYNKTKFQSNCSKGLFNCCNEEISTVCHHYQPERRKS